MTEFLSFDEPEKHPPSIAGWAYDTSHTYAEGTEWMQCIQHLLLWSGSTHHEILQWTTTSLILKTKVCVRQSYLPRCSEPKLFWWNCTKTKFPPSEPLSSQFLRNPSRASIPYQTSPSSSFRRMYEELENGDIDWITPFFPGHYWIGIGTLTSAELHYIPRMLPNLLNTFSH